MASPATSTSNNRWVICSIAAGGFGCRPTKRHPRPGQSCFSSSPVITPVGLPPASAVNYTSRTSRSTASTWRSSSWVKRPTGSPSRDGSTAAVCSASTRVSRPSTTTSGRKLAGSAEVDVGATSNVDSGSASDCTTTAYRAPRCSWPRAPRGERSRWTSPRTQRLHVAQYLRSLGAILLVGGQALRLRPQLLLRLLTGRREQRLADGSGNRRAVSRQRLDRASGLLVRTEGDRASHETRVSQNVGHRWPVRLRPAAARAHESHQSVNTMLPSRTRPDPARPSAGPKPAPRQGSGSAAAPGRSAPSGPPSPSVTFP